MKWSGGGGGCTGSVEGKRSFGPWRDSERENTIVKRDGTNGEHHGGRERKEKERWTNGWTEKEREREIRRRFSTPDGGDKRGG